MAFRTNKVPAIEDRTVSGSSVSFNSAFALPLKACKVSFSATQAGSGDPSPSNPRAISGVSAIGLTANSTPVSVSLGDTRYGGVLDVLTGILTVTHTIVNMGAIEWVYTPSSGGYFAPRYTQDKAFGITNIICEIYKTSSSSSVSSMEDLSIKGSDNSSGIYVRDLNYTDSTTFRQSVNGKYMVFQMKTPIEVQLSANELSSIIGNNTFSTDTGTLEITFADLQEKSASGAVVSFNSALAMPLASCNIAVNAWQEGSGDPSPSNVRAIHGFSKVNATRCGVNLLDKNEVVNKLADNGATVDTTNKTVSYTGAIANATGVVFRNFKPNTRYTLLFKLTSGASNLNARFYYTDGTNSALYGVSDEFVARASTNGKSVESLAFSWVSGVATLAYEQFGLFEGLIDEEAYEPYTGNTYLIQLGQDVYGGIYNSVTGKMLVTWILQSMDFRWAYVPNNNGYFSPYAALPNDKAVGITNIICDIYKTSDSSTIANMPDLSIKGTSNNRAIIIRDNSFNGDTTAFREAVKNHYICYELNTPFDIQLTPTQIETIIGNNTIFADTGDIDLTYKDLDIAKRGNFREVFKLPS